jgi:hypothetical protein
MTCEDIMSKTQLVEESADTVCSVIKWHDHQQKQDHSILKETSWALVAHTCHPSYSGGRDQEDRVSRQAPGKFSRPYLEKTPIKKGGE